MCGELILFITGAGNGCGKRSGDKRGLMYCTNDDEGGTLFEFNG
jgi:hypothetical protein